MLSAFWATENRIARLRDAAAGLDPRPVDIDRQINAMARNPREESLGCGAAGRLAGRGEVNALPLDDADLLEAVPLNVLAERRNCVQPVGLELHVASPGAAPG